MTSNIACRRQNVRTIPKEPTAKTADLLALPAAAVPLQRKVNQLSRLVVRTATETIYKRHDWWLCTTHNKPPMSASLADPRASHPLALRLQRRTPATTAESSTTFLMRNVVDIEAPKPHISLSLSSALVALRCSSLQSTEPKSCADVEGMRSHIAC